MSTKNDYPGKYKTLLWRKSVAENYLHNLKELAERKGIEKVPKMIVKIKAAERAADHAAQLFDSLKQ